MKVKYILLGIQLIILFNSFFAFSQKLKSFKQTFVVNGKIVLEYHFDILTTNNFEINITNPIIKNDTLKYYINKNQLDRDYFNYLLKRKIKQWISSDTILIENENA